MLAEYSAINEYLWEPIFYFTAPVLVLSPLLLAIAFGWYAVARRRFTLRLLFVFLTCECVSLGIVAWMFRQDQP